MQNTENSITLNAVENNVDWHARPFTREQNYANIIWNVRHIKNTPYSYAALFCKPDLHNRNHEQ